MTSLPSLYSGLVWDGVTEYANEVIVAGSNVYILRLDEEGVRFVREQHSVATQPFARMVFLRDDRGWTTIGVSIESSLRATPYFRYDGGYSAEPVNQIPYLLDFRAHAARFAHELDDAMGHHSLSSAEESDRLAVRGTLRDMIGSAWIRYDEWAVTDPEELIVGGNFDGTPLWSRNLDDYRDIDRRLCSQCSIATFARQVLKRGNIPLLKQLVRSGIVYSIDRSMTPWGAEIFDAATQPESQYYIALDTAYEAALDYYDTVVAPAAQAIAPDV